MEVPRSAVGSVGGGRRSRWQRGGQRHLRRRQRHQRHEHGGLAEVADGGAVGPYEEGAAARLRCVVRGGRPRPNVTWVSGGEGEGVGEWPCFIPASEASCGMGYGGWVFMLCISYLLPGGWT